MTDRTAKMMEKVRALLAKADATNFPAEAETFRAKADELMTMYSIEAWQIEQLEAGRNVREVPERRDFDRAWRSSKFRQQLLDMFDALATHCRCVVGYRGAYSANIPVYGLSSDLDYLDVLFTSLLLEVAKNMSPPVDPDADLGEQVFKQRQSGIAWPEITRKVYKAGLVTLTAGEFKKLSERAGDSFDGMDAEEVTWQDITDYDAWDDVRTSIKNRLANANRRYVKDHNLQGQRNYVKPEIYQRSFMYGFGDEIRRRLRAMRAASETAWNRDHEAGSMALAVRDIRSQALALYEQEYPPPPPVPVNLNAKPGRALKVREVTVDYGAMAAGSAKAREANLSSHPSKRVGGNRKGLER